jgi:hypothetical protein
MAKEQPNPFHQSALLGYNRVFDGMSVNQLMLAMQQQQQQLECSEGAASCLWRPSAMVGCRGEAWVRGAGPARGER